MNNPKAIKTFLVLSSIIGIFIGAGLLFSPVQFHAGSQIILGDNVNLFSETRAGGAGILFSALLMLAGIFKESWKFTSLLLSCLLYLSYGLGRLFSVIIDGMPSEILIISLIIELFMGFLALTFLGRMKARKAALT
ncbi:MAG: DUF4345 domain-containing protein [Bacteroidota bacterium]